MINFSEKKTSKDVDLGCLLLLVSTSTANNNAAMHQLDKVIIMFYAMHLSVSVSEGTQTKTCWAFEKKAERDYCVECNPTFYPMDKATKNETVKLFNHFRETWSGLFLMPVEK